MEDYKEKYNKLKEKHDKLIEAIKALQELNPSDGGLQNWVNDNVPELAESEGEKIRKVLIDLVKCNERSGYKLLNNMPTSSMIAWLEKQGEQMANLIDIDAMVLKYSNTREKETNGLPVNCQIRAYRQGINDALNLSLDIEKPITIGKKSLTGKAAELAKEVTPESLEEARKKLIAEEKLNERLNEEIQDWYENSEHMDSLWCTVKDAIELTARHFYEFGLKAMEDKKC